MKKEKTESYRKISFKSVITFVLCLCCVAAFIFAGANVSQTAKADGETVEVMNEHFSVTVSSYNSSYASDQQILLQYDKAFTDTEVWFGNGTTGLAATNLGDYLVINGRTYNDIKNENKNSKEYASVDEKFGNMKWGGVWSPVSVHAIPTSNRLEISINRGFADIGGLTIGIKDGFSYTYNGTTFKVEGDLMFKATLDADAEQAQTPIFKKLSETESETKVEYIYDGAIIQHADRYGYMGFTVFPLLNKMDVTKYGSSQYWLANNYMYFKEYIRINGKSVNYWNIVKYDESVTYTPNAISDTITGRVYATPIQTSLWANSGEKNNGGFQVWINRTWADNVGIDLNNFTFELAEDMPFIAKDGSVCRTTGLYKAIVIDKKGYFVNDKKEITPSVAIKNVTEQTALKHLVVDVTLSEPMDDIVWHMIDGYTPNANALTKILINGKSVSEINSSTDTSDWDWSGGCGFNATNALLQKPVLILCNGGKMTIYINGQYRDLLSNGKNTDVKIKILDGVSVMYQETGSAGTEYLLTAVDETAVFNRTYTLSVYLDGEDGEAVTSEVVHGSAIDLSNYQKDGYTVKWADAEGNDTLTVMPEKDYAVYAEYTAIEYTAEVKYLSGTTENVTYTIENKAEKLDEIKQKLTKNTAEYEYVLDKTELPLENCTVKEVKKPVEYTLTIVYSDSEKENETRKFTVENRETVCASLSGKLTATTAEYSYAWDKTALPLEDVTVTEVKTAVEYTLTIKYLEKADETLTFTVENKDDKYNSLADKITPDSAAYTYNWDKSELKLENTTITEKRTANEYTLTLKYADKAAETIKFTVETRDTVLASLTGRLTPSTADYEYSWKNLPKQLELKNQTIEEEKKAVKNPTVDSSDSGSADDSGNGDNSSSSGSGCGSGVIGGSVFAVIGLFAAAVALKKKKD